MSDMQEPSYLHTGRLRKGGGGGGKGRQQTGEKGKVGALLEE